MKKVYVVTGYGLNCEEETQAAYDRAGAAAAIIHAEDLFSRAVRLGDAAIVHLTGGFSFGDDLGSGRLFATRMRHDRRGGGTTLAEELLAWVRGGGHLVGICNGFQILVKSGLLPNLAGTLEAEATLAPNTPAGFIDRWVRCAALPSPSPAFDGLGRLDLPIRHGEGRLLFRTSELTAACEPLVALRYESDLTGRPLQPNGSALGAAALTDPTGHVLGAMPHPEAFLDPCLHPGRTHAVGPTGLAVFENLVRAARDHA